MDTTIPLVKYLYETYGWLFVGTIVPSDSKDSNENSVPFRKLTQGALDKVGRGWMRQATKMFRTRAK